MTQEEKELLLKDLNARLPYEVKCKYENYNKVTLRTISANYIAVYELGMIFYCDIADVKPYLFPLSSMTEEQKNELNSLTDSIEIDSNGIMSKEEYDIYHEKPYFECVDLDDTLVVVDWLNAHHFDYRRLIKRNLAIDATGLSIY